jgi:predicted outer membrane protein
MRSSHLRSSPWIAAALVAAVSTLASCDRGSRGTNGAERVAGKRDSAATRRDTLRSGGEVVAMRGDDAAPAGKWLTDANLIALAARLNARERAAAEYELQWWSSDTTREFAMDMYRAHGAIGHAIDSVATTLQLASVMPALGQQLDSVTKQQFDVLAASRGPSLDRVFIDQQISSHELMAAYYRSLAAAAENPELAKVINAAVKTLDAHLARARSIKAARVARDSIKADSAARRAERRAQNRGM